MNPNSSQPVKSILKRKQRTPSPPKDDDDDEEYECESSSTSFLTSEGEDSAEGLPPCFIYHEKALDESVTADYRRVFCIAPDEREHLKKIGRKDVLGPLFPPRKPDAHSARLRYQFVTRHYKEMLQLAWTASSSSLAANDFHNMKAKMRNSLIEAKYGKKLKPYFSFKKEDLWNKDFVVQSPKKVKYEQSTPNNQNTDRSLYKKGDIRATYKASKDANPIRNTKHPRVDLTSHETSP